MAWKLCMPWKVRKKRKAARGSSADGAPADSNGNEVITASQGAKHVPDDSAMKIRPVSNSDGKPPRSEHSASLPPGFDSAARIAKSLRLDSQEFFDASEEFCTDLSTPSESVYHTPRRHSARGEELAMDAPPPQIKASPSKQAVEDAHRLTMSPGSSERRKHTTGSGLLGEVIERLSITKPGIGVTPRQSHHGVAVPPDSIPKVVHLSRQFSPCLPFEMEETDVTYIPTLHPEAGASGIKMRDEAQLGPPDSQWTGTHVYEQANGTHFSVRSKNYMANKQKAHSAAEVYRVFAMDTYSVDLKTQHIANKVTLPAPSQAVLDNAARWGLPPQLVLNFMVPKYPAKFFGPFDGHGMCLIYYLELPETWDPEKHSTPEAYRLMKRFFDDGTESDGTPTRDRLKLIPRIINLDQVVESGVISGTEARLINSYRDKPLLTRPQQAFFRGKNHLEIDLDVHCYAYVARRALTSFFARLHEIVFELGFTVQGNCPEELPEQVLACIRNYRMDFEMDRQLPTAEPAGGGNGNAV